MTSRSCALLLILGMVLFVGTGVPMAQAAEVNTSALSQNGWFSDDTRADGTGTQTAGTNLISDTLTDDPEQSASGTPAHDADIVSQILFGGALGTVPFGTHPGAVHLQIAAGSGSGKSQISHRKDDGTGHAPGSVFAPGFSMSYSWMGDGTPSVTPSIKFGIKTSEFIGGSSRTGENVWDKVLIYEPGNLNGGLSDGLWHTDTVDFTTGKWWFYDRAVSAGSIGTPLTLSDMSTSAIVVGGRPISTVYSLITAPGAHITSVQVGIGSGNAGGSVYVNQLVTNFYRSGDVTTFGSFPVHNVTQSTDHNTIQEAINAATAGDVIQVDPGTYVEQVDIPIAVTILGAGVGSTVIQAPAVMVPSFVAGATKYAVVHIHDTDGPLVQDLTVDGLGNGNANNQFVGVGFRNGGGTLDNLHVTRIRDTPFSGAQHGVAIYAYNDDAVSRTVSVQDCLVDDFQKNAFALNASATNPMVVDVAGNTVIGAGATTVTAQNGIQVFGEMITGTVSGNDVSDVAYDNTLNPIKYVATSLLNYYADVDFTGNTVTGGHVGIYNIDGAGDLNNNDITIEKIGVYAFGIIATDPPRAVPVPYDEPAGGGSAPGMMDAAATAALLNVDVSGNILTFVGGDNTDTFGIEVDGGFGPDDLAVTITNNEVYGFDVGVELYQCTSSCDSGVITSVVVNNNSLVGNSTGGVRSNLGFNVDATCNWWGDINGPDAPAAHPNPGGDPVVGDLTYAPWLDGSITGSPNCDQYGNDNVFADTAALTCITAATPCVTVPVEFVRSDATTARGVTVTIQLSSGLSLCGAGIVQGSWLAGYPGFGGNFLVTDNGGGSYTIDQAILGTPCGPTVGGTLFTVDVTGTLDGTESITVTAVDARDCGNPFAIIPGIPGAPGYLTIDYTAPGAIADLGAAQQLSGNGGDSTTVINLNWTAVPEPDAATVEIYRKGFGFYPEYDDNGGSAPSAPATPAAAITAGWTLAASVSATLSSYADEPANRDYWYYVAFVVDDCGNVGAVSNRTDGDLNYHLGDVANGVTPGTGNNVIDIDDISALGAAYGTSDPNVNYRDYLDVGPTVTNGTLSLPLTDSKIQFEDLIIFAINHGVVSKPAGPAADRNEMLAAIGEVSGSDLEVTLTLASTGNVQAVSVPFSWNPEAVELIGFTSGDFLDRSQGVVFQPAVGTVDIAALGGAFRGEGDVVTLRFRVIGSGDPEIGFGEVDARDTENRPVTLPVTLASDRPGISVVTRLMPSAPNPFRAGTTMAFSLAEPGQVKVQVYSLDGRLVRTLLDELRPAGDGQIVWDGADGRGRSVASGTYLIRMESAFGSDTQRVVRLK